MRDETRKKVERAVRLLRSIKQKEGERVEIAYSGGKDSDVILELARMADIPHKAIYKSTTIDPHGTIMHAVRAGAEIRRPKRSFFQLVAMKGLPTRFSRFCCAELKEYPSENYNVVLGVRRDESRKRVEQFKQYPGIMRLYIKAAQRFLDTHRDGLAWCYYQGSAAQMIAHKILSNSSPDDFKSMRDFGTPMSEQDFRHIIAQHFGWEALPKEMR